MPLVTRLTTTQEQLLQPNYLLTKSLLCGVALSAALSSSSGFNMATSDDNFSQRTANFLEWFTSAEGTRLSDKIQLVDLREQHAGRGVGESPKIKCLLDQLLTLSSRIAGPGRG